MGGAGSVDDRSGAGVPIGVIFGTNGAGPGGGGADPPMIVFAVAIASGVGGTVPDTGVRRRGTIGPIGGGAFDADFVSGFASVETSGGGGPVPTSVCARGFAFTFAPVAVGIGRGGDIDGAFGGGGNDGDAGVTGAGVLGPAVFALLLPGSGGGILLFELAGNGGGPLLGVAGAMLPLGDVTGAGADGATDGELPGAGGATPGAVLSLLTGGSIDARSVRIPARNQPVSQDFSDEMQMVEVVSRSLAAIAPDMEISRVRAIREPHRFAADVLLTGVSGDIDRA